MGNRSTLINKATPDYQISDIGSGSLAAKNSIAVFWPSLFDREDLHYMDYLDEQSRQSFRIPHLSTPVPQALHRWQTRKRSFSSVSAVGLSAMSQFDSTLASMTKPYLIMDTWEIWTLSDEGLETFLLESIEQSAKGDLSALMEQAQIREGNEHLYQYTGFPWNPL